MTVATVPALYVHVALEQLEDGDQAAATLTLLDALEDGIPHEIRARCRHCDQGFPWPGLRDEHEDVCTRREA